MRHLFFIGLFYVVTCAASANTLQERFANLNTWQADFVQTLTNQDTETTTRSTGTLWLLRPNRFRLEYLKPYKQVYVADGDKLWFYDEDLEQVTVKPQGNSLDQTPAMILSQPKRLNQSYRIAAKQEANNVRFTLTPKSAEAGFERIELLFHGDQLNEMHMYDHFAQRTSLLFNNIHSNPQIPSQRFQFTPPADVDVIGEQ